MRKNRCLSYFALLILLALPSMQLAHAMNNEILVVPARARTIKLAFDIQALRNPTIISYGITDDPLNPLMHVWNPAKRSWQRFPISEIASRIMNIPANPETVYIISLPEEDLEVISTALSHANDLLNIPSMSVATILTTLNRNMAFTTQEWQALAERYQLEITELNFEKRRWGRFGPPKNQRKKVPSGQPFEPEPAEEVIPKPLPTESTTKNTDRQRFVIKPSTEGQPKVDVVPVIPDAEDASTKTEVEIETPRTPAADPIPEKGASENDAVPAEGIDVEIDETVEPMKEKRVEVEAIPLPDKGQEQPTETLTTPPTLEEEEFPIK